MEPPPKRVKAVRTAHSDETELVSGMLKLYNGGSAVDVDPCYSKGRVWRDLPSPKHKGDIDPQNTDVEKMDATLLTNFTDSSLDSIFFDPPFLPSGKLGTGAMSHRFSHFATLKDMYAMYEQSLKAFFRVLTKRGVVFFKCQDLVNFNRQHLVHVWITNKAVELGFEILDLFVLYKDRLPMMSTQWRNQVHARKNHCFYLVLRKK